MSIMRFKAIETISSRKVVPVDVPSEKISDYFACNVFTPQVMRNFLTKDAYEAVMHAIHTGDKIDRKLADQVANGMKHWAHNQGATHYTHWFQPLTGSTAEKHDAFFEPAEDGQSIEKFTGNSLVQQEPDASSFPNGGIRNTFEARGYTAWDPSSPAFIMENTSGKTLCIPTIFVSYTGEALDYKAPLLKALHILEAATVDVCSSYFDKKVTKAHASLGIEQEYFLVDSAFYLARPDLMLTGRTLVGHTPAKGQQLEDHYFGSIPERVYQFMLDFETESLKLGIPLKTRHNEVAPSQFECAPMFEEANLAVDHNQLLMDIMEKVAKKHNFEVLLHEKPFAGINGSGKHNNWSIITNTGINLLSPGSTPMNNLQFLTFFVNIIKAVHDNADLMRASIASAANDHRLGANEAPPAIMSIFIGTQLSEVLKQFESTNTKAADANKVGSINFPKIPEILLDNTDRNRTSPFAFTGNKFEFRAVGSSANCSSALVVLNTVVANQLIAFKKEVDALVKKGEKTEAAIAKILRGYIKTTKKILFEGNGYGDEWVKEATKRGLKNIKTTPQALDAYVTKQSKDLFIKNNIFNEKELEARHEIMLEDYIKKIQIESRVMGELAHSYIVPAALNYQKKLSDNAASLKLLGVNKKVYQVQLDLINEIGERVTTIVNSVNAMVEERKKANNMADTHKRAIAYCNKIKAYFDIIRYNSDKLELIVEDELWQLPKYREMLFIK
ncbi:MAG: glutamine synthetase III [Bacteroidia bacterium]|nr:glutamine synthetase III [Bacteroidia bacterium]MBP7260435.1 glutamine synthetase III [Bacteroidia bacterium]MBP9179747.1 glutamine synthetase III [Bacteroidia bacterium]MBP9724104.1 glutamine synthetase III [Bacteroidia bacterium]